MNCGNGCAGPVLEKLEAKLPVEFTKIYPEPDGRFPNGIPNPLLPENRGVTAQSVISNKVRLGIAWTETATGASSFMKKVPSLRAIILWVFLLRRSEKIPRIKSGP